VFDQMAVFAKVFLGGRSLVSALFSPFSQSLPILSCVPENTTRIKSPCRYPCLSLVHGLFLLSLPRFPSLAFPLPPSLPPSLSLSRSLAFGMCLVPEKFSVPKPPYSIRSLISTTSAIFSIRFARSRLAVFSVDARHTHLTRCQEKTCRV